MRSRSRRWCSKRSSFFFTQLGRLEKERRVLQFKDSNVLQSVLRKQPVKPMLNTAELVALAKNVEEQKVIGKVIGKIRGRQAAQKAPPARRGARPAGLARQPHQDRPPTTRDTPLRS